MKHPNDPFPTQEGISDQLTLLEKQSLAMPLSLRDRSLRLTKLWSVKEAYTKAIGEGITFGLERIEVELSASAGKVERVKVDGRDVDERGMLMAKKRWISRRWNQDSLVTSDRGEGRGKKRERQDNATGRLKGQG